MHRFDDQSRLVFHYAKEEALQLGHQRILPEHLLLGVLRIEHPATKILTQLGLTVPRTRELIEEIVGKREALSQTLIPEVSQAATATMEAAASEARRLQATQISIGHVLLGILRQADSASRTISGGTISTQILGELDGGLRSLMRCVLASIQNTPQTVSKPIAVTIQIEEDFYFKMTQHASNTNQSLENAILEILRTTIQ
jgi:ATP-dependent Clp protease ATP-binding subunit ClpA